jgi:hypothetical protein
MQSFRLSANYALEDAIRRNLQDLECKLLAVDYGAELEMNGLCPITAQTQLQQALADLGRGQIVVEFLSE